ncbi:phage structural protein [Paracandidimonas lactea]|uniref:phage structural protein n=1 Tax=Paracandidimonas lactea TaxID=2895524 RepID=UPI001F274098|nr:phage protein [Paracandidimonas lactea]
MAQDLKTYSPDQVKVIIGPHTVTGTADGTFITIEPMGDGVTSEAGAYGDVARAMSLDPRHTITVTLQQTSRSNDVLSALHDADRLSGGNGAVPIAVTDLRGTTLFAGTGWVVKKARATFSKGLEAKEWALEAVGQFTNGGND